MPNWSGEVRATLERWARDANAFVRECLKATPDPWQAKALAIVSKHGGNGRAVRLALKACKGPGKTTVLAWIILWFLCTRPYPRIGCTSITEANIDSNLWPELYKWMKQSAFLMQAFVWTKSAIVNRAEPQDWWAQKRTWPKHGDPQQQADALAGLHADHVMFVGDEVGGYPQAVMATAEAVLSTEGSERFLVIAGNPTHTSGPLYIACTRDRKHWHVVTITGDPESPDRSPRISLEWAKQQIASYGRDNPWVQINVLGEFPPASINALLGLEDVEAAMHRKVARGDYEWAQKRFGVDVARFGDDRTSIFPRQGIMSWRPATLRNMRTTNIAARVARGVVNWQKTGHQDVLTFVDDTGHWGHGVIDNLTAAGFPVIPVVYSAQAPDPRFRNMRAYKWMMMADWVKAGGVLPEMPELIPELTEIQYSMIGGRFVLEEKEQMKLRLGYSPDHGDSLSDTFAMPDMPAQIMSMLQDSRTRAKTDFDPYAFEHLEGGRGSVGRATSDFDPNEF
jgi:phage terminase large subunit